MIARLAAFVLPLGLDTLAIAVALGIRGAPPLRAAVTFAVFEALTPLAGLAAGSIVPREWQTAATIAGGIVLDEEVERLSFSSIRLAMVAGLAVSMDELAIGFPLRFAQLPVPLVLATMGLQALVVAFAGMTFGRRLGERFAAYAGRIAGIAFCCVGLWLAVSAYITKA